MRRHTRDVEELRERRRKGTGDTDTGILLRFVEFVGLFMIFRCECGVVGCDDDIFWILFLAGRLGCFVVV